MMSFARLPLRVTIGLVLIGTTALACKSRARDQDDDDDDDAVTPAAGAAAAPSPTTVVNRSPSATQGTMTWTFDSSSIGQSPAGFSFGRTGSGRPGRWVVRADADAPSAPNALARRTVTERTTGFPSPLRMGHCSGTSA